MNFFGAILLLALVVGELIAADVPTSTNSYLTKDDKLRLKKVLEPGFKFQDLASLHYAIVGYKHMKEPIKLIGETCEYLIKTSKEPRLTAEQLFYVANSWKSAERCQPKSLNLDNLVKSVKTILDKDGSTVAELYYSVSAMNLLNQKIPDVTVNKLVKTLQLALKKDDSPLNLAYVFHIAAHLGSSGSFAFNHIEDAMVQADEVDGRYLQFEGGLSVTSLLVNGVFKLSQSLKKKAPLTQLQIVKLANYFLSRRSVQTPKGVANFLSSINTLATNEFYKPTCITLKEDGVVISVKQPFVHIKVCDLLGNPVPSISNVIANTATKEGDDVVFVSKKNFEAASNDKTVYSLNFMTSTPEPGFYKIAVSAGSATNTVLIKVLTEVKVSSLEIGTADADQTTQAKLIKVAHPEKLKERIEADSQQKLVIRFLLKDAFKDKPMRVHQAFVRLSTKDSNNKNSQEIIFVAEPDSSHTYKFDMQVGAESKNFAYQSGDYKIELIIGDAILSNSFEWTLGTIALKFPEPSASDVADKSTYRQKPNVYTKKPEIKHMFREPEKRPPEYVSNLFSGLCIAPIFLLIFLWAKIGVNISNFPFSISAITFHLGLGGIFVLFGVFWLQLNMFTTLRYLSILGTITFLAGNKMLSQIAKNRKLSAAR
ncbi:hypothetical protein TKK_0017782 [Trichogramma kaykai]